jgi:hypothetical protein
VPGSKETRGTGLLLMIRVNDDGVVYRITQGVTLTTACGKDRRYEMMVKSSAGNTQFHNPRLMLQRADNEPCQWI